MVNACEWAEPKLQQMLPACTMDVLPASALFPPTLRVISPQHSAGSKILGVHALKTSCFSSENWGLLLKKTTTYGINVAVKCEYVRACGSGGGLFREADSWGQGPPAEEKPPKMYKDLLGQCPGGQLSLHMPAVTPAGSPSVSCSPTMALQSTLVTSTLSAGARTMVLIKSVLLPFDYHSTSRSFSGIFGMYIPCVSLCTSLWHVQRDTHRRLLTCHTVCHSVKLKATYMVIGRGLVS